MSPATAPVRICSLLPSATEIVCALGLREKLVAVTHECDYPAEIARLPRITSSAIDHAGQDSHGIHRHISEAVHSGSSIYHLDRKLLEQLNPDLILTQELCDVCAVSYQTVSQAARMLDAPCRVLSLEPTTLEEIFSSIETVGRVTRTEAKASALAGDLQRRVRQVEATDAAAERVRVLALEWLDPPFVGGHWVPQMIEAAGGLDVMGRAAEPSREVRWEEIKASAPEVIVLMPCGFDLQRTLEEFSRTPLPSTWGELAAVQAGRVYAVDGSAYFNRPGPRIVDGVEILAEIIQPKQHPRLKPASCWQRV